jgi:glycosyltransferase involved in cell wall biosynthesis
MELNKVVWLVNNVTHYHRARAEAFSDIWSRQFEVIEISNRNPVPVLHGAPCDRVSVTTLFEGTEFHAITRAALREAILEYLDRVEPCVCCLNGWGLPGTAVMLDWATRNAVPCVLTSDTNEHDSPRLWWKEEVKRRFVAQCGAALVGGAWHRDYLIQLGMPRESVFDGYDVVDNEHFKTGAERAKSDADRFRALLNLPRDYFVACARFEPKKNIRGLIEAYGAYVRQVESPCRLVIVGDGPSRAELESAARGLGLGEKVLFRGLAGYQELPGIYGLARAFVHASTTEQWGLVVNEAMAAGLPVLVSKRCGCVAELVEDGVNGWTFDPWKTEEIAQRMLLIHRDSSLSQRMGRQSAAIIAGWGLDRFARNLRRAVEFALNRAPRKRALISRAVVGLMAAQ